MMRVVLLLVAAFVAFASLSEAAEADPHGSNPNTVGWLILLVICLLACLSVGLCFAIMYLCIFKGGPRRKGTSVGSRKDKEVDQTSASDVESADSTLQSTSDAKKIKEMEAQSPAMDAFGKGSTLPVCPNCPLRSTSDLSILTEKPEQKPPSYDETMRNHAPNKQSSVSSVTESLPDVRSDQRGVKPSEPITKVTTPSTQHVEPPMRQQLPRRSRSASMLTARGLSFSTDDSSELDDQLVVNQMRSEDMIRPKKPIFNSCVRPPPVSAEAINEIAGGVSKSSSDPKVSSVAQPKMIHIGFPTVPKYIPPGSSESVSLLSQRSDNDSNIMYSQEHLVDYTKKGETKGPGVPPPPRTLSQQNSAVSSSVGSTQATKTVATSAATTQLSSVNSCATQPTNVPTDVSTRTAVEETSVSEGENSSKSGKDTGNQMKQ